ncbi:hypothetical protein OBE_13783, partial [human gut metagenome]
QNGVLYIDVIANKEFYGQKILTLAEKWEIDAQAYKDGASVITASPQCEFCKADCQTESFL